MEDRTGPGYECQKTLTEEFQVDLKNWSQWLTIFNCREVTELCDRLQQDNKQATVANRCSTTAGEPPVYIC